jgi:hypothetical protein
VADLGADVELDAGLIQQFESASEAAREAIAERQQERAADEERARAVALEQAERLAIVQEIEELNGEGRAGSDRRAEGPVDALPPMPSDYAASLTRRFQDASRAFEDRERRRLLAAAAAGRLETLATELEQLVASGQPVEEIVARWRGLRATPTCCVNTRAANPTAAERLERAVPCSKRRSTSTSMCASSRSRTTCGVCSSLCRQVEILAAAEQVTLKAGDRALRDIRTALDSGCRCRRRRIARRSIHGSSRLARSLPRACRSCAMRTSGSAGPICRCRKSCAAAWKR